MGLNDIVRCIADLLLARHDVRDLSIPSGKDGCEFYYEGGPKMLEDRCIFDDCTIDIKISLLEFFFSRQGLRTSFNWNVNIEFAKLAAKYGSLVEQKADKFFPPSFTEAWGRYFLHMAYFGSSIKHEHELVRLIEMSPEDGRDGLFVGSWFSQSEFVQHTLIKAFSRWVKAPSWDACTGEMSALRDFLSKWRRSFLGIEKSEHSAKFNKCAAFNHLPTEVAYCLNDLYKSCGCIVKEPDR